MQVVQTTTTDIGTGLLQSWKRPRISFVIVIGSENDKKLPWVAKMLRFTASAGSGDIAEEMKTPSYIWCSQSLVQEMLCLFTIERRKWVETHGGIWNIENEEMP